MGRRRPELMQGTLQLLILKTLSLAPLHGLGVARRIEQVTRGDFKVSLGALFPALHALEEQGFVASEWGASENNRKAKFYRLTAAGRRQLEREERDWARVTTAMSRVLEA
jgi:transcriptional regulator